MRLNTLCFEDTIDHLETVEVMEEIMIAGVRVVRTQRVDGAAGLVVQELSTGSSVVAEAAAV